MTNTHIHYDKLKTLMKEKLSSTKGAEQVAMEITAVKQEDSGSVSDYHNRYRKTVAHG